MYWEKTIEYYFLWRCSLAELTDFAAPLSGKIERAGDAIFGHNSKLLLIEFKRDENSLDSEKDKFDDFEEAKKLLTGSDSHHILVYGEEFNNKLDIKAKTYFSRTDVGIVDKLPGGLRKKAFNSYLVQFLAFRKQDGRSEGRTTISDFSSVIGLNPDGKIIEACTFSDYAATEFPSLVKRLTQDIGSESTATRKIKM